MRPTVPERHAESLGVADDDVRTPLSGRAQERQRQEIGGDGDQHAGLSRVLHERREVMYQPGFVRCLE